MSTATPTKTVWVYNGFTDLELPFNGKKFRFPVKKILTLQDEYVSAPDEYRRNHETDPDPAAKLERTIPAQTFAEMLFNRHYQNLLVERVVWIGDREPTPKEISEVNEAGRRKKIQLIKQALADQASAMKGGGRVDLDTYIIDWMQELDIKDDVLNPSKDTPASIGEEIAKGIVAAMAQLKQPETVTGTPKK